MINSVGKSSRPPVAARPVSSAMTAASAICGTGCLTVVSCGQLNSDSAVPSKDTMARSPGTERPASWAARSAPIASRSELANIAVGRFVELRRSRVASYALVRLKSVRMIAPRGRSASLSLDPPMGRAG
jgi:hypothetical protein